MKEKSKEDSLQYQPNHFDGFSYLITRPADIEKLDPRAKILLEPGQVAFLEDYPDPLTAMIKKAARLEAVPNLAKWLASLWNVPVTLEIHTSSELYDMDAVWLRFKVREETEDQPAWQPAFNLLGFSNIREIRVPDLLREVFAVTGEINHNGYGVAGRLHHPDLVGNEATFYETYNEGKAFYHLPDMAIEWEFSGGYYETEEARQAFGLYEFEDGLPQFLNLYFGELLRKRELKIDADGSVKKD
ncbi:MAG: hypothetical protein SVR81_07780 [Chloroflexota bacterium]|nr:hypothetical protein [Chloroflexota bacterium]